LIEILAFIGIFTNFAIMSFTAEAFGKEEKQFISFIWVNVAIFVIRFIIQELIPNEPENVFNIRQRHKLIVERTLGRQGRIEDAEVKGERTDFYIKNTNNSAEPRPENKENNNPDVTPL
jgi:hypothetical protein